MIKVRRNRSIVSVKRTTTTDGTKARTTIYTGVVCNILPQNRYAQSDDDSKYRGKAGEKTNYNIYFDHIQTLSGTVTTITILKGDLVTDANGRKFSVLDDIEYNLAQGLVIAPAVATE